MKLWEKMIAGYKKPKVPHYKFFKVVEDEQSVEHIVREATENEIVKENDQLKERLTQAMEIIQKSVFQNICYNCDFGINHCNQCRNGTLRKQAEQFLKGENIILEDAQAGNSPFDADKVFNKEMKAYSEDKNMQLPKLNIDEIKE